MVDSSITPGQQAFINSLQEKVAKQLGSQLDGTFSTMPVPSGFPYFVRLPPNNYYNENMLSVLGLVPELQSNGVQGLGNQRFKDLYQQILQSVVYGISDKDQKTIDDAQIRTANQASEMITAFENAIGTITPGEITKSNCYPETKAGYIDSVVAEKWGGDPKKIPLGLAAFSSAYQTYYNDASDMLNITARVTNGRKQVAAAIGNAVHPSGVNGGLQIDASAWDVAYANPDLPANTDVQAALDTASNAVTVSATIDNLSTQESHLSVEGHAGFTLPIADILELGFKGSASYSVDKYAASATQVEIETTYPGITMLFSTKPMPLSPDNEKGWYSGEIIKQVIEKTGNKNTSGFKLNSDEFSVKDTFGQGKQFARVKTWVLSQQPTVKMTFIGGESDKVASNFQEQASVEVKLFGLFDIGGASESYSVKNVDSHSVAGQVTVTLGPTKQGGSTDPKTLKAYVLGGVIDYPTS